MLLFLQKCTYLFLAAWWVGESPHHQLPPFMSPSPYHTAMCVDRASNLYFAKSVHILIHFQRFSVLCHSSLTGTVILPLKSAQMLKNQYGWRHCIVFLPYAASAGPLALRLFSRAISKALALALALAHPFATDSWNHAWPFFFSGPGNVQG